MLFSEKADFAFEIFILEFGVIVTAEIRIIERVVVQIWKRGFVSGVWTQHLSQIIRWFSSRDSRQSVLVGVKALLLCSTD